MKARNLENAILQRGGAPAPWPHSTPPRQERGRGRELLSALELGAKEERRGKVFSRYWAEVHFLILLVLLTFTFLKEWKSVE